MKVKNSSHRFLIGLFFIYLLIIWLPNPGSAQSTQSDENVPPGFQIFFPLLSQVEVPRWIGPQGGIVTAMAVNPQEPHIVYAGSWGAGVFKSVDGGQSWFDSSQGLDNLWINSIAVDPQNPSVLYAGTYKGKLYKSLDGGQSWFLSSENIQPEAIVYTIAIDPRNSSRVFIGTRGISNDGDAPWQGTGYKSSDHGQNWKPVLTDVGGASEQDWAYAIAVHPLDSDLVYAATHEHGIYRSTDGGEHWYPANNGISDLSGRGLVVDPRNGEGVLYLGVWHRSGVFKSTNGGDSWVLKNTGIGDAKIYSLSLDPQNPDRIFAATFTHGVLKSSNAGESWSQSGLWPDEITSVVINPKQTEVLLAGTHGNGIFRSLDGGHHWTASQQGLYASQINALWIDPQQPWRFFAGSFGGGMLQSNDSGNTWKSVTNGLIDRHLYDLVQHPQNPNLFYALTATAGLYRCDLSADCWTAVDTGLALTVQVTGLSLEHPRLSPQFWPEGIALSQTTLSEVALLSMAFAPSNANILYLGTSGSGVLKSTDGGDSWQLTSWRSSNIWDLAVSPEDPAKVYAIADASLLASHDGGVTWFDTGLTSARPNVLAIQSDGTLLAGTGQGLYHYFEGQWHLMGLAGRSITQVVQHPKEVQTIYCGTTDGVYYSLDGGSTWQPGPAELAGLTVLDIGFEPSGNYIYFSTQTRGILRAPR